MKIYPDIHTYIQKSASPIHTQPHTGSVKIDLAGNSLNSGGDLRNLAGNSLGPQKSFESIRSSMSQFRAPSEYECMDVCVNIQTFVYKHFF